MAQILVADDEESLRCMLQVALESDGHTVTLARDGMEALERASEEEFDLVITDYAMPRLNGRDLLLQLRKHNMIMPVILLCSQDQGVLAECAVMGFAAIYLKPVVIEHLLHEVKTQLGIAEAQARAHSLQVH